MLIYIYIMVGTDLKLPTFLKPSGDSFKAIQPILKPSG